ncbi:MAG: hypothetical protein KJZ65_05175 [Phycisphaerales bacterium]|nr:hypothetical protein [Phycisphaerales bacterium]
MGASPINTLCWLRADQVALVRAVAQQANLHFVSAGTEDRGRSAAVAADLHPDARAENDLRAAMSATDAAVVLLADAGDFGELPADASAVAAARGRGTLVCSLEPIPPSVSAASASEWAQPLAAAPLHAQVVNLASPESNAAMREARHALDGFGAMTALSVSVTAGSEAGSLGARLYAAMDLIFMFAGQPEVISAQVVQPRALRGARFEKLSQMHGTLTASVRFADQRAAAILASNQNGPWHHGVTILGEGGRLRVWDEGFVWTDPSGRMVDEHRSDPLGDGEPAPSGLADRLRRAIDSPRVCAHNAIVLAMAETALLSARTGNAESPSTLLRVAGTPDR